MYQSQYHQNLGTGGHRATSSFNYLSQYSFHPDQSHQAVPVPSTHYLPPPSSNMLPQPQPMIQPTMVGVLPPPPPPPLHAQLPNYPYMMPQAHHVQYQHQPQPQPQQNQQHQEAAGGINPVLEYDLNTMSTFLSWCAFGMLKQRRNPTKDFENLVNSVLFATRLPKSTIVISLEYMNQRFSGNSIEELSESDIFVKLITGLILGNKFNDDNTFTNKSWCGATGLNVEILNKEEQQWLKDVNWQLNVVNFESNILTLEECWKTWLDKYCAGQEDASPVNNSMAIPSSPISPGYSPNYYSNYGSSPVSSPIKYSHDSIWSTNNNSNIWSYAPNYQFSPHHNPNPPVHQPIQYLNSNFVGYTNPYYTFNMASC